MTEQGDIQLSNLGFSAVAQGEEDDVVVPFSAFNMRANRKIFFDLNEKHQRVLQLHLAHIEQLTKLLKDNNINVPEAPTLDTLELASLSSATDEKSPLLRDEFMRLPLLRDGSAKSMTELIGRAKEHIKIYRVTVIYRDLNFWTMAPERTIPTVGSTVRRIFFGTGPKNRVDIIRGVTGMIRPGTMTLVMGPPGCGKSTFLKALSGLLNTSGATLDGNVTYNGMTAADGKFLVPKLVDYINETDVHSEILTVKETLMFAWKACTGGVPMEQLGSPQAVEMFKQVAESGRMVQDVLTVLGLRSCQDTVVGGNMLKGISGGQKRRVTLGEMMVSRHSVKCCDAISNGLDAATTFDINNTIKIASEGFGSTIITALLQPAPEVFNLFDNLVLMSQGQLIYHGPRESVIEYFEGLGYVCPAQMDVADFLQEIPTPEGVRFVATEATATAPVGTEALVKSWLASDLHQQLLDMMTAAEHAKSTGAQIVPAHFNKKWANSIWFYYALLMERQIKLVYRDKIFLRSRVGQSLVVGGIAGSLFSNLDPLDVQTINGVLYYGVLSVSLAQMSILATVFAQREVFYKQSKALFYPSSSFVFAQTLALMPVFIVESLVFSNILYWSVGLSGESGRFATYWVVVLSLALCIGQYFRMLGSLMSSEQMAQPLCGVSVVIMVLFSGYIIPSNKIPPGWEWFYHINPVSWALRSVTINQYQSGEYDQQICSDFNFATFQCNSFVRLGDSLLEDRGIPADSNEIWYGVLVMWAEFLLFLLGTSLALTYVRAEVPPPPPIITPDTDIDDDAPQKPVEIKFEPLSFAFKDIWYTITLSNGDELDILKGISGYFEPGTVTALIGSSGAGKTTLLDVLAGRKNTGVIGGEVFVNGRPKDSHKFRRIMGYVEQFDSLCPHDTAREALEFSAALRLPGSTTDSARAEWVDNVLEMLELSVLENTLVGDGTSGMSFEQKKRVSIGVELVANPSILFLDEPTSGLDSRAAQVVMRCIKRVASGGRAVVATIHQPSVVIFNQFDALLLLRRGGQTVFFGPLGDENKNLQEYLEGVSPSVPRLRKNQNPATWMLEVIGAGTGNKGKDEIDLHAYYNNSELCATNNIHIEGLCCPHTTEQQRAVEGAARSELKPVAAADSTSTATATTTTTTTTTTTATATKPAMTATGAGGTQYNASYTRQFTLLMKRSMMSYWRSPSYNFVRMVISVVIALIFASAYANQQYTTDVDVIARTSVIYITVLFTGVVGMICVEPVFFSERPAFYREKKSDMYSVLLYNMATGIVELPYLLVSSLLFTLPFFFIVGFDKDDVASKFMWYWLFQALYMSCLVFTGQFLAALMPDPPTAGVIGGVWSTLLSLFCGFMIKEQDIPTFWLFIYWLDPLHYVLEGLNVTQFHGDNTPVAITIGVGGTQSITVTAEQYIEGFFPTWEYDHRYKDVVVMVLFILFFRACTYAALRYIDHKKN